MLNFPHTLDFKLSLHQLLVRMNKAFIQAVKARKPIEELQAMHSEIQELYNHICLLKEQEVP